MSLAPTTPYLAVPAAKISGTTDTTLSARTFFPGSVETITISDGSAADYTKTVASVAATEVRPYSLVKIAVTGGHFTVHAVVSIDSNYHQVGDVVEFVFTPSDIVSPRTITIKDNAATPNTLATLTSTSDASRTSSTRKFVLGTTGTWLVADDVPATTVLTSLQPGSGATVSKFLVGTKASDPASVTGPNTTSDTVTVTGAAVGDYALATFANQTAAWTLTAYVSAPDTVTVVYQLSTGTVNLASGTLNVLVIKAS